MNALITGATKGIGKAITEHLSAIGFNLAICARNEKELYELNSKLIKLYPNQQFISLPTDCGDKNELIRFTKFVLEHFQYLDVLINNAGMFIPSTILDEESEILDKQMHVNVYSAYYLSKVFGKQMRDRKSGHIFNICSIASKNPVVAAGSYSVTKFALLGLTKVLRDELMAHKVKVTAVLPGSTLTDSWAGTKLPSNKFVHPDDVAKAILNCLQMSEGANVDEIVIRPLDGDV